jgi:glycosyltransferase involved in cell wall biosynthesis
VSANGRKPTPRVSVITTTFRTPADLLAVSLASMLGQTLGDIELILVADGPLDDAQPAVLDAHADPRLMVLRPGRIGRARALNLAIEQARGALIAIQDADDASHAERLERQAGVLDRRPDVDLLGAGVRRTASDAPRLDWSLPAASPEVEVLDKKLLVGNPLVHSSVMARRASVEAVGGYAVERRYQFDHDLYLRMRDARMGLGRLRDTLVVKRVHAEQEFESVSPFVPRLTSAWRLQIAHARLEPRPARYVLMGAASVRLGARVARGSLRRVRARA